MNNPLALVDLWPCTKVKFQVTGICNVYIHCQKGAELANILLLNTNGKSIGREWFLIPTSRSPIFQAWCAPNGRRISVRIKPSQESYRQCLVFVTLKGETQSYKFQSNLAQSCSTHPCFNVALRHLFAVLPTGMHHIDLGTIGKKRHLEERDADITVW